MGGKNVLFILTLVVCTIMSCQKKGKTSLEEQFVLSVTAKGFPDSTKVYLYNRDIDKNLDSAFVINQRFEFSGKVDLPSLCYLNFYDKENNPLEPYHYFFLENDSIFIEGDYSNFIDAKVVGSEQSDLLAAYYATLRNTPKENRKSKQLDFLFSNADNQMALNQLLYIKKEVSKDSLLLFHERLDSINSTSPKGLELLTYAKTSDIKPGDKYRNIVGYDLDGEEHQLFDYKGKVILLDFWGTGCVPCRKQNKEEFPRLMEKYNEEDFVLISYSLDKERKWWEKASKEDKINWINISDLVGMKSENVQKYAVTAIPNSFLIDKNGTVVKSFVGFYEGENSIEREIDKLLAK